MLGEVHTTPQYITTVLAQLSASSVNYLRVSKARRRKEFRNLGYDEHRIMAKLARKLCLIDVEDVGSITELQKEIDEGYSLADIVDLVIAKWCKAE